MCKIPDVENAGKHICVGGSGGNIWVSGDCWRVPGMDSDCIGQMFVLGEPEALNFLSEEANFSCLAQLQLDEVCQEHIFTWLTSVVSA